MFRYLSRLRQKPLELRRQAALVATLVVVVLVIIVWFGISTIRALLFSEASPSVETPREVGGIATPY